MTPPKGGTYKIQLRVEDEGGLVATASATIEANTPPTAKLGSVPSVVTVGSTVPIKAGPGNLTTDPEDDFQQLDFSWSVSKKPGGSQPGTTVPQPGQFQVTPDLGGNYQVSMTVTDTAGSENEATVQFKAHQPPSASIEQDVIEANPGESFQIDATKSKDPETHQSQLQYKWEYTATPDGVSASSLPTPSGAAPGLQLAEPGTYTLQLTVIDEHGEEATDTVQVEINSLPKFVDPTPDSPIRSVPGGKITFDIAVDDPDGDSIQVNMLDSPEGANYEQERVEWDPKYGEVDESGTEFVFAATDGSATVEHTVTVEFYTDAGTPSEVSGRPTCDELDCGDGESCHFGGCFEDCSDSGSCSGSDAVCLQSGRCASEPCARIKCGEGESCYRGSCFSSCEDTCTEPNHRCIDGRCAPNACDDVDCPTGQSCYQGSCFAPCETTDDCNGDNQCVEGRCTSDPCAGVQCPDEQRCYQGSCFSQCSDDSDCDAAEESCFEGRCAESACDGVQCPGEQVCFQGSCYDEDEVPDNSSGKSQDDGDETEDTTEDDANRSATGCGCSSPGNQGAPGIPLALFIASAAIGFVRLRKQY